MDDYYDDDDVKKEKKKTKMVFLKFHNVYILFCGERN